MSKNREIEIKVLDVNPEELRSKLQALSARFLSDEIQRIYTYDLAPISATFVSIKETIKRNVGNKEKEAAKQKLKHLLLDLLDLLSLEDQIALLRISQGQALEESIDSIASDESVILSKDLERIVSKYHTNPNKWIRLRESGGRVTIALKQIYNRRNIGGIREHSINDVKEIEIEIDDFEGGMQILNELGYFHKNYQEKRRISYVMPTNVKVDIDFWAYIPPYVEIEGDTEQVVYETLARLGFDKADARVLNADDVYTLYGLDMYSFKELKLPDSSGV